MLGAVPWAGRAGVLKEPTTAAGGFGISAKGIFAVEILARSCGCVALAVCWDVTTDFRSVWELGVGAAVYPYGNLLGS